MPGCRACTCSRDTKLPCTHIDLIGVIALSHTAPLAHARAANSGQQDSDSSHDPKDAGPNGRCNKLESAA